MLKLKLILFLCIKTCSTSLSNLKIILCKVYVHFILLFIVTELSEFEKQSSTSCLPDASFSDESKGLQITAKKFTLGEIKVQFYFHIIHIKTLSSYHCS